MSIDQGVRRAFFVPFRGEFGSRIGKDLFVDVSKLCTDQADDADLVLLKEITQLERLYLGRTDVTDAGVADLQKALPECSISHDPESWPSRSPRKGKPRP